MAFVPELFDSGCDRQLPVDTLVDTYDLSAIIPLSVTVDDLSLPVLVNPGKKSIAVVEDYLNLGLHRRLNGAVHSYASAVGGVSAEHLAAAEPKKSLEPMVPSVKVDAPAELLVEPVFRLGDQQLKFEVSADVARALLSRQPALVRAVDAKGCEHRVELIPGRNPDNVASVLSWRIEDLPSFIERPVLQLHDGRNAPVTITAAQKRDLILTGRSQGTVAGVPVDLQTTGSPIAARTFESAILSTPAPGSLSRATPTNTGGGRPPAVTLQRPVLPLAIYLPIEQKWKLLGYSRGALIHSVALAPQEELTLEVFSWNKRTRNTEDTATTESTAAGERSDTDRDTSDVLNELTRTTDIKNNVGGNFNYSGYGVTLNLGGGINDDVSVADVAKRTTTDLHERVVKTTTQLKAQRQVKVTEGSDSGTEERVTRRIKNPNMCHALAIDTFEILVHYQITTRFLRAEARPCVLVGIPLKFTLFDRDLVRQYESVLSSALLEQSLLGGFAAARLLAARDYACTVACQRCLCGDPKALLSAEVTAAFAKVMKVSLDLRVADPREALWVVDAFVAPTNANSVAVEWDPNKTIPATNRWMYTLLLAEEAPELYRLLIDFMLEWRDPVAGVLSILAALGNKNPNELAIPRLLNRWPVQLRNRIYQRYALEGFREPTSGGPTAVGIVANELFRHWPTPDDAGLIAALKELVAAAKPGTPPTAEQDPVGAAYPLEAVASALEREEALIAHLNDNSEYYRGRIFLSLPMELQRELLGSKGYEVPGIDLIALGRVGSSLAYPITPALSDAVQKHFGKIIDANVALDAALAESDVVLPTPGIHLQTRLSECDACEPYLQNVRNAEVRRRNAEADALTAKAEQEKREVERLEKRLASKPPNLEDPFKHDLPHLKVTVENEPPATPEA